MELPPIIKGQDCGRSVDHSCLTDADRLCGGLFPPLISCAAESDGVAPYLSPRQLENPDLMKMPHRSKRAANPS